MGTAREALSARENMMAFLICEHLRATSKGSRWRARSGQVKSGKMVMVDERFELLSRNKMLLAQRLHRPLLKAKRPTNASQIGLALIALFALWCSWAPNRWAGSTKPPGHWPIRCGYVR